MNLNRNYRGKLQPHNEMEEVISGIEYMREEIDASDKENVKSKSP